jgi:hypothetical protein
VWGSYLYELWVEFLVQYCATSPKSNRGVEKTPPQKFKVICTINSLEFEGISEKLNSLKVCKNILLTLLFRLE